MGKLSESRLHVKKIEAYKRTKKDMKQIKLTSNLDNATSLNTIATTNSCSPSSRPNIVSQCRNVTLSIINMSGTEHAVKCSKQYLGI